MHKSYSVYQGFEKAKVGYGGWICYCSRCPEKYCSLQKWSKVTKNYYFAPFPKVRSESLIHSLNVGQGFKTHIDRGGGGHLRPLL